MMGEEVEGFEARSMTTIRAGNVDGRAGRFKRDPTSFDAALTRWDSTHRPRRAQRLTQPVRPCYLTCVTERRKAVAPRSCLVRTAGEHHQFTAAIRLTSS
jgi:hypothetical protein